jgi:hypothetical protein
MKTVQRCQTFAHAGFEVPFNISKWLSPFAVIPGALLHSSERMGHPA